MTYSATQKQMQEVFNAIDEASKVAESLNTKVSEAKESELLMKEGLEETQDAYRKAKKSNPVSIETFKIIKNNLDEAKGRHLSAKFALTAANMEQEQAFKRKDALKTIYSGLEKELKKQANNVVNYETDRK